VKDKVKKHCSFSTLPKTMVIDNSTSFNHYENFKDIWLLANNARIREHELQSVGGFIAITTLTSW